MLLLLAGLALAEEPLDAGLILVDPLVEAGEREEAALALARMGGAEAVELLQAGLYSRVPGVPKAALLGLSEIGDTRALGVLAEAVLSRHARVPAGLRLAAISAIERAATDEAGEVLLALAGEDELSR
jgi:HEAT repeat protein